MRLKRTHYEKVLDKRKFSKKEINGIMTFRIVVFDLEVTE